jgi:pimeloyl-ACP methyl ester carboxylesterase
MRTTARMADIALAYEIQDGRDPVMVFCPGFNSDMNGSKAQHVATLCAAHGQACLRFDYGGHGASGGRFIDGCIGDWAADAAHVIETAVPGREIVLVGSSMGGWISLLLARELGVLLRGLVLIAPAPDFTDLLLRPALSPKERETLETLGVVYQESEYGPPVPMTLKLIEDGARHLVLRGPLGVTAPVRILHGMADADVPYGLSLRLVDHLTASDVRLTLIKDGDHRLSRPEDLALLGETVAGFFSQDGG